MPILKCHESNNPLKTPQVHRGVFLTKVLRYK